MSTALKISLLVAALVLPGLDAQTSSRSGDSSMSSGSGSGSGTGPAPFPLASVASLTQEQRNNILTIGFQGITAQQFLDIELRDGVFSTEMANIVNQALAVRGRRLAKRQQALIRPEDVTVLDTPTVMNGVLIVGFVVGGQGGQGSPISSAQMEAILQREGPNLARAMNAATGLNIKFAGVMAANQPEPLSQSVVIGIVIGVLVAVVLIAVLVITITVVCCVKAIRKKRAGKATDGDYVQVPDVDDNTLSSKCMPLKVDVKGDYVAAPNTLKGEGSVDPNSTNTAM